MAKGFFLTLEGGEGTGKTSLTKALAQFCISIDRDYLITREPGGTKGAEAIRELLVKGEASRWDAMSEICLFYAARNDHIRRVIVPALSEGKIVICDRFFDSTRAYQGKLGANEEKVIKCLEENIVGPNMPDLTLILDIDVEIGLKRAMSRMDQEGRFESKTLDFHNRLRQSFLEIAIKEPERCKIIDAAMPIDLVHEKAIEILKQKMSEQSGKH